MVAGNREERKNVVAIALVASLVAAAFVYFFTRGENAITRDESGRSEAPVSSAPGARPEAMVAFIKRETCQPSTCSDVVCETFSDGQTKALPAHVVRCRWTDTQDAASPKRCAYIHYAVDSEKDVLREMYLSSPAFSDVCQTDKAFTDLLKGPVGYSGSVP